MVFEKQQGCENNTGYSWSVPRLHHSLLLATEQSRVCTHLAGLGQCRAGGPGNCTIYPAWEQALLPAAIWDRHWCLPAPAGPFHVVPASHSSPRHRYAGAVRMCTASSPLRAFLAFQDVVGMRQSQDGCLRLTEQPQHCLHHLSSLPLDFPRGTQWDGDTKVPPPKSLLKLHLQSLCPRSCLSGSGAPPEQAVIVHNRKPKGPLVAP